EMDASETKQLRLLAQLALELAGAAKVELARRVTVAGDIGRIGVEREAEVLLRHKARDDGEMTVGMRHAIGRRRRLGQRADALQRHGVIADNDAILGQTEERQIRLAARPGGERGLVRRIENALDDLLAQVTLLVVELRVLHGDEAPAEEA